MVRIANQWTKKIIAERKAFLKKAIEDEPAEKRREFLDHLVESLSHHRTPQDRLDRFLSLVNLLVFDIRARVSLSPRHRRLADMARKILVAEGILPVKSRLAFLYGEIELAMSQLARHSGLPWQAAWWQQMSFHLSGLAAHELTATNALGLAIRSMRLGFFDVAYTNFALAQTLLITGPDYWKAAVGQLQLLRLAGRIKEGDEIDTSFNNRDIPEKVRKELDWERELRKIPGDLNLDRLINLLGKKKSHYHPVYLLEFHLWTWSLPTRKWEGRIPSVMSMVRSKNLIPQDEGALFEACRQIEMCYDSTIPFEKRLEGLGKVLSDLNYIVSIDRVLLILAAASRWLIRSKASGLATLSLAEYRSVSFRLSSGKTEDSLGICTDLLNSPLSPPLKDALTTFDKDEPGTSRNKFDPEYE